MLGEHGQYDAAATTEASKESCGSSLYVAFPPNYLYVSREHPFLWWRTVKWEEVECHCYGYQLPEDLEVQLPPAQVGGLVGYYESTSGDATQRRALREF